MPAEMPATLAQETYPGVEPSSGGRNARMAGNHGNGIRPEQIARVVVRPIGTVLPLGFLAFGTGIFVTAAYGLGWIPPADGRDVFLLVLVFVTPIEAVTSV